MSIPEILKLGEGVEGSQTGKEPGPCKLGLQVVLKRKNGTAFRNLTSRKKVTN